MTAPNDVAALVERGLNRSLNRYAACTPEAVAGGSHAQMLFFVKDAKADIEFLATTIAALQAEVERVKEERADEWRARRNAQGDRDVAQAACSEWRRRAEATETANAGLLKALDDLVAFVRSGKNAEGYCMCGAPMEPGSAHDNHTAVDMGEYHAEQLIQQAEAARSASRKENTP